MHISKITFKTNVALKPFQHEHAEVTVELAPGDGADHAFAYARGKAREFLGIDVDEDDINEAEKVLAAAKKAGLR